MSPRRSLHAGPAGGSGQCRARPPARPYPVRVSAVFDPQTRAFLAQEPQPGDAEVVAGLYQRLLQGYSMRAIAQDFQARGIRTRSGREWTGRAGRASVAALVRAEPVLLAEIKKWEARVKELSTPSVLRGLIEPGADVTQRWAMAPFSTRRELARILLTPDFLGQLRLRAVSPAHSDRVRPKISDSYRDRRLLFCSTSRL